MPTRADDYRDPKRKLRNVAKDMGLEVGCIDNS
jgi:hypothetical protein